MSDLKESNSINENIESPSDGLSELKRFISIDTYDIKTKTDNDINIVLMGEAVAHISKLAMKSRNFSLKALEEHLNDCCSENKRHGISFAMMDELYDYQNETSLTFERCRKLIDKINESFTT